MLIKNKKVIFPVLLVVLLIMVGAFVLLRDAGITKLAKVLDYGDSICTTNIPPSNCGPYDVTVELSDGQKATYKVDGFDNRDSEQYDKITSKITDAKNHNKTIELRVNDKSEIIAVE